MSTSSPWFRPRLPELATLVAVVGVGALVLQRNADPAGPPPPETWRCGAAVAASDCLLRVPGATVHLGGQSTDPRGPGYDPDATPFEGPVHERRVGPFWLQKTEVTVGSYRRCVRAGACRESDVGTEGVFGTWYPASAPDDPMRDPLPVTSVSWDGAVAFCAWISGRLPSEAEWERAARGADGRRWPWGDDPRCPAPPDATGAGDERPSTSCQLEGPGRTDEGHDVGPLGFLGMAGNVAEWTTDAFTEAAGAPHPDPVSLPHDAPRAVRGGSWMSTTPAGVRLTLREGVAPTARLPDVGFRCAWGGTH